ncbi:MAG: tail fiber domain-containing protein [Bdellovibrionales bacterium]|nr:tail fiber domain-containing protein [Bdellovibrionales bacterium]
MDEASKALERSSAARGGLTSGRFMKELMRQNQGMASEEYNNAYNRFNADRDRRFGRLSQIAGVGQTANTQVAQAGQNYANAYSQNVQGGANAVAAQAMGQAGQRQQFIQGAASLAFCDERVKTNIQPVSKEDLAEMKSHLKAYSFNYKSPIHGSGDYVGVMAQDLEKSKLGKTLVYEDADGVKLIDLSRVLMLFLATMAEG